MVMEDVLETYASNAVADNIPDLFLNHGCSLGTKAELVPTHSSIGIVERSKVSRHCVNSGQVVERLRNEGVEVHTYSLEKMSFCKQMEAVAKSSTWAGPHGAGLFIFTSLLFQEKPIVNFSPR